MAPESKSVPNAFVRQARKVYYPLGFKKGYNFILFVIFNGAFLGFTLSRFEYLSFNGVFCSPVQSSPGNHASPGECYWYRSFRQERIGITLHLATILPASLLAVFQFVPAIRYKALLYHRIAGYVAILLALISQAGVLMIAAHSFGGDNSTRTLVGALVILTTGSLGLAYYNIKRLQIDQHRVWMLRAWFYFASIITLRLIMIISALVAARFSGAIVYIATDCAEIIDIYHGATEPAYALYPACNPANPAYNGHTAVHANFLGKTPVELGASLHAFFGASGWLALLIHAIGVETYLRLTPREGERLRQVSYERQMERGLKHPGSAGLVAERLGDADEWTPKDKTEATSASLTRSQIELEENLAVKTTK